MSEQESKTARASVCAESLINAKALTALIYEAAYKASCDALRDLIASGELVAAQPQKPTSAAEKAAEAKAAEAKAAIKAQPTAQVAKKLKPQPTPVAVPEQVAAQQTIAEADLPTTGTEKAQISIPTGEAQNSQDVSDGAQDTHGQNVARAVNYEADIVPLCRSLLEAGRAGEIHDVAMIYGKNNLRDVDPAQWPEVVNELNAKLAA